MEDRGRRHRDGAEAEGRDNSEVAAAGTSQRPEQVLIVIPVALDYVTVREDDLRAKQMVTGEAVLPAEYPEPAAECETGDPDRVTGAGRESKAVHLQRVVEPAETYAGADRCHTLHDRHGVHGRHIDDHPFGRRTPRNGVPSTSDCHRQAVPPRKRNRLRNVRRIPAENDRIR